MSGNDDKQVQDALLAIKKLVEMSEEKLGSSDDVLTLDHVVWRNPVQDETEQTDTPITAAVDGSGDATGDSPDYSPDDTTGDSAPTKPAMPVPQAAFSVSARDLDALNTAPIEMDKIVARKPYFEPSASPSDEMAPSYHPANTLQTPITSPPITSPPMTSPLETEAKEMATSASGPPAGAMATLAVQSDDDITELTSPLGRRGGGFYAHDAALLQKPALQTSKDAPSDFKDQPPHEDAEQATLANQPSFRDEPSETIAIKANKMPIEPAITDFYGADFNFSAAEGLMTAASFSDLHGTNPKIITPEVTVAVATPAVDDPVGAVRSMFEKDEAPDSEDEVRDDTSATGHPNLHIVSDQTQMEEDEEGFSGAVRLALRSIIKEQVSAWLQGNMSGLIEEALSPSQKRTTKSAKPSGKKR